MQEEEDHNSCQGKERGHLLAPKGIKFFEAEVSDATNRGSTGRG